MIQSYRKFETTVLVRMGSWPFSRSQLPRRIFLGWGTQKLTPLDAHIESTPDAYSRMEGGGFNPSSQHLLRDAHTMSSTSWLLGSRQSHKHHPNLQESHSLVKEAHTCSLSLSHTQAQKENDMALRYVVMRMELWIQLALVQILASWFPSCVTSGRLLNLFPRCFICKKGKTTLPTLLGCCEKYYVS